MTSTYMFLYLFVIFVKGTAGGKDARAVYVGFVSVFCQGMKGGGGGGGQQDGRVKRKRTVREGEGFFFF